MLDYCQLFMRRCTRLKGKKKIAGVEDTWIWYAIAVVRADPESVVFMDGRILVFRTEKQ